ncbi:MAG TPA: hypothetical protein PKE63_06445 [Lacibacter sp.]|nr:hypothetical protein [Lacibacter sp.]HMO87571.1 hypothetical protein [Lacibacter sp.]HMP86899.1 hypothetical protein [Lacibacter sp.]
MSKLFLIPFLLLAVVTAHSQNFQAAINNARSAYTAGKLEEAHFALMQAMQEVDLIVGKEVLKLLPQQMGDLAVNVKDDNVTTNAGFLGTTIHRTWGTTRKADLSIIGNSPMIATINMFLNTPMLGGMVSDGNTKLIRIKGYKGQLQRETSSDGKIHYNINIPLGNALFTFKVEETSDTEILKLAETIPLDQIVKLIQ